MISHVILVLNTYIYYYFTLMLYLYSCLIYMNFQFLVVHDKFLGLYHKCLFSFSLQLLMPIIMHIIDHVMWCFKHFNGT